MNTKRALQCIASRTHLALLETFGDKQVNKSSSGGLDVTYISLGTFVTTCGRAVLREYMSRVCGESQRSHRLPLAHTQQQVG